MDSHQETDPIIAYLVTWGQHDPRVRAMVLTSSRAIPDAGLRGLVDPFSDYDVILALSDVRPFFEDRTWLEAFGRVLVLYRDPLHQNRGFPASAYVTQFESGLKIDFSLWSVDILRQILVEPALPEEFDAGYRVLLDKDGLTAGLRAPTYRGYIPTPPTESQYLTTVELLFHEATYVAKHLRRGDLMAAKENLDHFMKQEDLRPMLEWLIELDNDWTVKPGPYGRRLRRWLRPELWAELEATYCGPDTGENWDALFRTIALFRKVAVEVGQRLGYPYPHDLDRRAVAYLEGVRSAS